MSDPTLLSIDCPAAEGPHRMAFWQWGDPAADHLVVCVHGLARQGLDFDVLARALVTRADHPIRVIAPDVVGRGRSDWLRDPMGYAIPTYVADLLVLLTHGHAVAPVRALDWVGTSMGGLIGLCIAGQPGLPLPVPIRRLVLNDVGPVIQWAALQRIGEYLGQTGRFATVEQAADLLWTISTSFGPHTRAQWLALCQPMLRALPEGGFTLHYDPAIAVPFRTVTAEVARSAEALNWQLYDAITARTLLVRGADSDLLSAATAREMTERGPRARLVEFPGVGHAPMFVVDNQVDEACRFLLPAD